MKKKNSSQTAASHEQQLATRPSLILKGDNGLGYPTVEQLIDDILATRRASEFGAVIGESRSGRPIRAACIGHGETRVSLIGGCHADEPVGPRLLRHLVAYLQAQPSDSPILRDYQWWILPHLNPDGEVANRSWYADDDTHYNLIRYLKHVTRELPGDDIEFGFPHEPADEDARPENRAAYDWWQSAPGPFQLHASLHGMMYGGGPWFLLDASWRDRTDGFQTKCQNAVTNLGYELHDVQRHGEKGFVRIETGFCTRPDSAAMREYFLRRDDATTAALFRPSSMETVRSLGGDPLTLVSEMPLFIAPGVGRQLGPPDPVAEKWKKKFHLWHQQLQRERPEDRIRACAASGDLRAMPVRDQMQLQWTMITAGLEAVVGQTTKHQTEA